MHKIILHAILHARINGEDNVITPLPRRRTMSYCLLICASISETFSVAFFPDIVAAAMPSTKLSSEDVVPERGRVFANKRVFRADTETSASRRGAFTSSYIKRATLGRGNFFHATLDTTMCAFVYGTDGSCRGDRVHGCQRCRLHRYMYITH